MNVPTPPAGHSADYDQGFHDGAMAVLSPPVAPPVDSIDLAPLINSTPANGTLRLNPVTYHLNEQALLTKPIVILGNGTTIIAPAVHCCFNLMAPGIVIRGCTCYKANQFAYVQQGANNCEIRDCVLSNVLNAVVVNPGVTGTVISNVYAASNSVTFYLASPTILLDCHGSSAGEYAVRTEGPGDGLLIQGGLYTNAKGNGHDTIGIRGGSGQISGVQIIGNIRLGQDGQSPVPAAGALVKMQIDNCIFSQETTGHGFIEALQGVELWTMKNTFGTGQFPPVIMSTSGGNLWHQETPRPAAA